MRISCNGCRVLRKGCSESCILRPCLHWISTAESQGNATMFLAKFYGRAGLTNLISNGPEHLRPDIFRSLLYEACGRIVNPIDGLLGLLWSGNWAVCQEGVESILQGTFPAVSWADSVSHIAGTAGRELHRSVNPRGRFKRLSVSKSGQKESKRAPISNHLDSSSKSDDLGNITNALENSKFNDKYIQKYSTVFSWQEQHEFVSAHLAQTEYRLDLCKFKTRQTEAEAPCDAVGLDLTLGSQG